ncbi:MAG TPA: 23S rRNA (adenine(2503)-C(2))-methyltransferase RlmN [Candidatus Coproplasma stercoravium]|nr:23S rRNA (adenine(2503)-C(2))-methyltransferase RlmN [Candidatus Coproplasma stercoravium]
MKKIIQDYNLKELEELVAEMGEKPFRAKQLYDGIMRGHNISDIPALPKAFSEKLEEQFEDCPLEIVKTLTSSDGTEKYLFRLADGNIIEGVFMKYKYGNTQCVSTQVGCRMGCKFCASTLGGLVRNLSSGEILSQVLKVNALHGGTPKQRQVTNVVLMGSGEPLDNYDNVIKFLRDLAAEGGINISPRNVSLSTCGLVPQMYKLAEEGLPVNLTVSLHNVTDDERARTMPIAKRYKIGEILSACTNYFKKTGRRYIFEYSLIEGENADEAHAKALIELLKGRPCHVNLIRLNEVKERKLMAASERGAQTFLKTLTDGGISATLRRRMGADIGGACGQLRASFTKI